MDDARREFVSNDGIRWQYSIEHQQDEASIAWRAHVWEVDDYRGVLEGRVWTTEPGDPDTICSVALKMALDANYLREFTQDPHGELAESAAPAEEAGATDTTDAATDADAATDQPATDGLNAADGLTGPDPLPSPA